MLTRIVQMTFKPENIPSFERIFKASSPQIRSFPGCLHLELLQDKENPCVFFTYSHWETEADLQAYRDSDFFREVWGRTRELFAEPPRAWSLNKYVP
jgi:heme-degrading monooxygenase HmoA